MQSGHDVAVGVQRQRDGAVAEQVLAHLGVRAKAEMKNGVLRIGGEAFPIPQTRTIPGDRSNSAWPSRGREGR